MSSFQEHYVFELSDTECHEIVNFIIDQHGDALSILVFIEGVLLLFEDIAGLEHFDVQSNQSKLDYLWRLYCEHRSTCSSIPSQEPSPGGRSDLNGQSDT